MQNENDLLEVANDLKEQYDNMQQSYEKRIALLQQKIQSLEELPPLKFYQDQFSSQRPFAHKPTYIAGALFNAVFAVRTSAVLSVSC